MLDLTTLAEARARSLNQGEDTWRDAVWSPDFQEMSQSMSDGEVEALISFCPTPGHLRSAVKFIRKVCGDQGLPPFTALLQEAAKAGLAPDAFIVQRVGGG